MFKKRIFELIPTLARASCHSKEVSQFEDKRVKKNKTKVEPSQ